MSALDAVLGAVIVLAVMVDDGAFVANAKQVLASTLNKMDQG